MLSGVADIHAPARASTERLQVRVVDDERGFDALREDWDQTAWRMVPSSPMLSWEWCRGWWRHFAGPNRLQILTFVRDGRTIGIAPFQERRLGVGALALRVLKPIGWEDYGNQGLTEHLELLFPPEHRPELMARLAGWLAANRVTSVWLPSMPDGEALPRWFTQNAVRWQQWVPFHHRALPSDWLAFVQGLNKSMRSNSRYYAKLLIRHGHSYELEVAQTPDEVSRALPVAIGLHRTRANASGVSRVAHHDHFYREDRAVFLEETAPAIAARGEFKVGLLHLDGEVVAAQMWFERAGTIFLYYSGFEPAWAKYGVQLVTTLEVLKHGMGRGIHHVEFLRGGGQLKERWDTEARVVRNVLYAPNRALAGALQVGDKARLRLRRMRWA
jgi:CelD/BcsL family acetyltransferase involved in cellulose biosynthesis